MLTQEDLGKLTLRELQAIEADPDNSRELCAAAAELKNFLLQQQAARSFEHFQAGTAAFRQLAEGLRKVAAATPADPVAGAVQKVDTVIVEIGDLALREAGIVPDPQSGIADDDPAAPATEPTLARQPTGGPAVTAQSGPGPATVSNSKKFEDLESEYVALFENAQTSPERIGSVRDRCGILTLNRPLYERAGKPLGIPWHVVAVIHAMEKLDFKTHLHNGDPLTAKTVHEPVGRPAAPPATGQLPYSWSESAEDALKRRNLDRVAASPGGWSLARTLFELEGYNGFGYRPRRIATPYLWSFCQHYQKGKFVRDRVFDPNAVSKQCGAAVLVKQLRSEGVISI